MKIVWVGERLQAARYQCGSCGAYVASEWGVQGRDEYNASHDFVYVCPSCYKPTYISHGFVIYPLPLIGRNVDHLPAHIQKLYDEGRQCMRAGSFTGATLLFRKVLMHVGVEQGADPNKSFQYYVDYIDQNRYVPVGAKAWVDHIRQKGNEATHEIVFSTKEEATEVLTFVEHLLANVYEMPGSFAAISGPNPGTASTP